jgi:hypothetical protein
MTDKTVANVCVQCSKKKKGCRCDIDHRITEGKDFGVKNHDNTNCGACPLNMKNMEAGGERGAHWMKKELLGVVTQLHLRCFEKDAIIATLEQRLISQRAEFDDRLRQIASLCRT